MQKGMFHVPPKARGDTKIYTATTGVDLMGFQMWQKPQWASMITIVTIGGGGGGGGGFTRTAGTAGGGGGSGACSGISRFKVPAIFLPDTLYVQVGGGGVGGAASANGGNGLNSYVLTSKTAVLPNIICYSGVNAPGGGGAGTAIAGGPAGAVPTIAVVQPTNIWGDWLSTVGLVGIIGGAQTGAAGGSVTAWAALPLSPGAPGGGCTTTDFGGGGQTSTALLDIGSQGYYVASGGGIALGGSGIGAAINGSSGVNRITPLFCSGGAGGGTNNVGQAGHGGAGGYGCGGGGGGAGATGGRGGNGGSGLVIIITT